MTLTLDTGIVEAAIRQFLGTRDPEALRAALGALQPADVAEALAGLEPRDAAAALDALPRRLAAQCFGYFEPAAQVALARALPRSSLQQLFADMPHDERADLWKSLPEDERDAILPGLAAAEREDIRRLASYPEDSAGAVMSSDYASLSPLLTAAEALDVLRAEAPDRETIYDSYVLDADRRLIGVVSLRDLLLAPPTTRVGDMMTREVVFVRADDPRESVAEVVADYDLLAVPVVDGSDVMVGIVTVDDALDVAQLAQARRLTRFGGTSALGGPDIDLMNTSFAGMFKGRFLWLALLTIFGMVSSLFVAAQEELLTEVLILAAFIAPIIDMGGNTGSQSATLVIRAMALGQLDSAWRDVLRVLRRDLPVAAALGVTVAFLEVVLAILFKDGIIPEVLWVVGLSMLIVTIAGSLFGVTIPFIARALRVDPATLSAPLITSVMDLAGIFIYFAIASAFLSHMLA